MINGNTKGIRQSVLEDMETLYEADMERLRHQFVSEPVLTQLVKFTSLINREVSVYVARDGMVMDVSVGSHDRVGLPDLRVRRGAHRLTGIRCIHTHPDGAALLSPVDVAALKRIQFDAMACVGVKNGHVTGIQAAFLTDLGEDGDYTVSFSGPFTVKRIPHQQWFDEIERSQLAIGQAARKLNALSRQREQAVLVGIDSEESLEELAQLADTAGVDVLDRVLQRKSAPDSATLIGQGKAGELALLRQALEANLVILDEELTGAQLRNLEQALGCRVIDRTTLILDIFARRATTHEGKLQVELAQYKYRLPRLAGSSTALSRLGGGIGTRGPGESQLETDRRRIRRRIHELEQATAALRRSRGVRRQLREKSGIPTVSLVGYTNAGKSTLLNALSGSDLFAENKLFATLDPVTRRVTLPGGQEVLFTDTVGFINKLPHDLIDAFHSTLEEALAAQILVIVVDGASDRCNEQYQITEQTLRSLEADLSHQIIALNKTDLVAQTIFKPVTGMDTVSISAVTGAGLPDLLRRVEIMLADRTRVLEARVPYNQARWAAWFHDQAKVLSAVHEEGGTLLTVEVTAQQYQRCKQELPPEVSLRPPENPA